MPPLPLQDRRVVITGASRGIGACLARDCAESGAQVIGIARNQQLLDEVMRSVKGQALACDLADPAAVATLLDRVEAETGPVDVWVHNAGLDHTSNFTDMSAEALRQVMQVNLLTPLEIDRQLVPRLLQRQKGHIVHVSSMAACAAFPGMAAYGATKAGLSNFHRILRSELRRTPIRMTLVEIGPVPTDMLANVKGVESTRKGFARMAGMHITPDVPPEKVARAIRLAIQQGRSTVRLPARAAAFPMLTSFPQMVLDLATYDHNKR